MVIVPVLVPRLSGPGSAVTVSVMPVVGSVPLDGVTVIHGLSPFAVNCSGVDEPGTKTFVTTFVVAPASVLPFCFGGWLTMLITFENAPPSSLRLLMAGNR